MADIYGSHFEYGGISSRMYGLIIAGVELSRFTKAAGSIEGITIFNKKSKTRYLIDDNYSDSPLSFDIEIVTDNDRGIELNERRKVEKWLFNRGEYKKFYLDISDDTRGETYEIIDGLQKQLYLNCRFVNPERLEYNGGIVGYKATLEADSGLWWQDAVVKSFDIDSDDSESMSTLSVFVDTDIDEYTYPRITIVAGDTDGDITLINNTDDGSRLTKFIDVPANSSITIKSDINYISGQFYEKFYKQNFPRLLDGENIFTVMGNVASVEFEFNNRRML